MGVPPWKVVDVGEPRTTEATRAVAFLTPLPGAAVPGTSVRDTPARPTTIAQGPAATGPRKRSQGHRCGTRRRVGPRSPGDSSGGVPCREAGQRVERVLATERGDPMRTALCDELGIE